MSIDDNIFTKTIQRIVISILKEMTHMESNEVERMVKVGFAGVEIHDYLASRFLSPKTNKRKDEYGGIDFIEFVAKIRTIPTIPLITTGGFRTGEEMNDAIRSNTDDLVGIGRPICLQFNLPEILLYKNIAEKRWKSAWLLISYRFQPLLLSLEHYGIIDKCIE